MFTGIIEGIGNVLNLARSGESARLRLHLGALAEGVRTGDSIAVDGACLTVRRIDRQSAEFDLSGETLQRTTLGSLRSGDDVNLERSLRAGDRIGGHFVLGHVDGIGTVSAMSPSSGQVVLAVTSSPEIISQLIPKGSVAVDGISLTVVNLAADPSSAVAPLRRVDSFSTAILPYTLDHTTLRRKSVGDTVNIELDVIGKYAARLLGSAAAKKSPHRGLSERFLEEHGFK